MSALLAELLVKDRILSAQQVADASRKADPQKGVIRYLIESKVIGESKLLGYLAQRFNLTSINLERFEIPKQVLKIIPPETAAKFGVIPIQADRSHIVVAVCDPGSLAHLEELKFRTKLNVEAVLTTFSSFDRAFVRHYGGVGAVKGAIETFQKEAFRDAEKDKVSKETGTKSTIGGIGKVIDIDSKMSADDAPVIQVVNAIIQEAVAKSCSDIHVEPYAKRFRVRLRIDGSLNDIMELPIEMKRAVVARFKIMSGMDIAESRIPQDGRIKVRVKHSELDFRVSTMPTLFGEKVVLRMLSSGNLQLDMKKLGFEDDQLKAFKKGIYSPNGMVLVTGPTGSGKTTTLYSALSELNLTTDNLSTVEDPVEYNLEGINQVQIQKEIGLTFASVLRTLLRQDPDTILVGEIRDYETAEVAIQAALTGHLVLSTLHTNDAPSTITRLMNMGVEPFLVTASVNTIVAQRLIRTICPKCRVESKIPKERLVEMGVSSAIVDQARFYEGKGCSNCNNSGYKGRVAIYEVLDFSQGLKDLVLQGVTISEIRKAAVKEGMTTLRQSAVSKALAGKTSLQEAVSNTMEG